MNLKEMIDGLQRLMDWHNQYAINKALAQSGGLGQPPKEWHASTVVFLNRVISTLRLSSGGGWDWTAPQGTEAAARPDVNERFTDFDDRVSKYIAAALTGLAQRNDLSLPPHVGDLKGESIGRIAVRVGWDAALFEDYMRSRNAESGDLV